jgi:hypothetical protein
MCPQQSFLLMVMRNVTVTEAGVGEEQAKWPDKEGFTVSIMLQLHPPSRALLNIALYF